MCFKPFLDFDFNNSEFFFFETNMICFSSCLIFPTLKRNQAFPPKKISLGSVGQSEDIGFFRYCASKRTLGKPSYLEDKTKYQLCLNMDMGFFDN